MYASQERFPVEFRKSFAKTLICTATCYDWLAQTRAPVFIQSHATKLRHVSKVLSRASDWLYTFDLRCDCRI